MTAESKLLRARDVMQRAFVSVAPHTPILSVHRMFVELRIHGAPVLDSHGEVVGVVSTLDLLRAIRTELEPGRLPSASTYFWDEATQSIGHTEVPEGDALWRLIVRDAMSKSVISVAPDTSIGVVARVMFDQHVHRVLVMQHGKLLGIVSTFDLLSAVAEPAATAASAEHVGYSR